MGQSASRRVQRSMSRLSHRCAILHLVQTAYPRTAAADPSGARAGPVHEPRVGCREAGSSQAAGRCDDDIRRKGCRRGMRQAVLKRQGGATAPRICAASVRLYLVHALRPASRLRHGRAEVCAPAARPCPYSAPCQAARAPDGYRLACPEGPHPPSAHSRSLTRRRFPSAKRNLCCRPTRRWRPSPGSRGCLPFYANGSAFSSRISRARARPR